MSELELIEMLHKHDWYHAMSDDHRVYQAGRKHWNQIVEALKQLPKKEARKIFSEHAPKKFRCPV